MSEKVFYRRNELKTPAFDIGTILRRPATTGEIGIEIEVEGNKFKKSNIVPPWMYVKDGSLRGQDNAEYVLEKPIMFDEVPSAIGALWDMMKGFGSKLDESNRTSVHVHLNAQRWHLNRLCSFFALYFAVEEILTEWCGDHRVGNLFCLRAKDAPNIISVLKQFFKADGQVVIPNGMHYAGVNASALIKFGSIEIRSLQGCTDPGMILRWVSILERIYKMSAEFPDPRNICDNFSGEGPINFLNMILGDNVNVVRDNIDFDTQRIMESMYDGIRLAQDLCYCRDWSEYKPADVKKDPFGRDADKVQSSLQQAVQQAAAMFETSNMYIQQAAPGSTSMATLSGASQSLYPLVQPQWTLDTDTYLEGPEEEDIPSEWMDNDEEDSDEW